MSERIPIASVRAPKGEFVKRANLIRIGQEIGTMLTNQYDYNIYTVQSPEGIAYETDAGYSANDVYYLCQIFRGLIGINGYLQDAHFNDIESGTSKPEPKSKPEPYPIGKEYGGSRIAKVVKYDPEDEQAPYLYKLENGLSYWIPHRGRGTPGQKVEQKV